MDWSSREETLLRKHLNDRLTRKLARELFPKRTFESVRGKRRRLRKAEDSWGRSHSAEKVDVTRRLAERFSPRNVVDAFAGRGQLTDVYATTCQSVVAVENSETKHKSLASRFADKSNVQVLQLSAEQMLFRLAGEDDRCRFPDWIDLDPFGSVLHLLPLATGIACPGYVCFTLTDLHQLRFGRLGSFWWRLLAPDDLHKASIDEQLAFVVGWILFDCSRAAVSRMPPRAARPRRVSAVAISRLGARYSRLYRVLLKVEAARSMGEVERHLRKAIGLGRRSFPRVKALNWFG